MLHVPLTASSRGTDDVTESGGEANAAPAAGSAAPATLRDGEWRGGEPFRHAVEMKLNFLSVLIFHLFVRRAVGQEIFFSDPDPAFQIIRNQVLVSSQKPAFELEMIKVGSHKFRQQCLFI